MKQLTAGDLIIGSKYEVVYLGTKKVLEFVCMKNHFDLSFKSFGSLVILPYSKITIYPYTEPNQTTMNTDYTEQPFNLETALKHPEWVRTRDGREIDFWKYYPDSVEVIPNGELIYVDKKADVVSISVSGFNDWVNGKPSNRDLILRVPYQTIYVSILPNGVAFWNTGDYGVDGQLHCVPVKIPAI